MSRFDLDGKEITPLIICLIGGGGFIGSHLFYKLMQETSHKVILIEFSVQKITRIYRESQSWLDRVNFYNLDTDYDYRLESLIKIADVVKFCTENEKRLIHFSTCEFYGKTIGSFLPEDDPLRQEANFNILKEDTSPCVLGPIMNNSLLYTCANQLMERLIYGVAAEKGLKFTIVRPFNWIGPGMVPAPTEAIPWVLTFFRNDFLLGNPIRLVDFGESQHTLVYIHDAIEAVLLMIENPSRANGQIFNVGNPNDGVTTKQLGEIMIQVFAMVSGLAAPDPSTLPSVELKNYFSYECVNCIPDITIINRQLGWKPTTSLPDLLEATLRYTYLSNRNQRRHFYN